LHCVEILALALAKEQDRAEFTLMLMSDTYQIISTMAVADSRLLIPLLSEFKPPPTCVFVDLGITAASGPY
jgi:hypothetical protein